MAGENEISESNVGSEGSEGNNIRTEYPIDFGGVREHGPQWFEKSSAERGSGFQGSVVSMVAGPGAPASFIGFVVGKGKTNKTANSETIIPETPPEERTKQNGEGGEGGRSDEPTSSDKSQEDIPSLPWQQEGGGGGQVIGPGPGGGGGQGGGIPLPRQTLWRSTYSPAYRGGADITAISDQLMRSLRAMKLTDIGGSEYRARIAIDPLDSSRRLIPVYLGGREVVVPVDSRSGGYVLTTPEGGRINIPTLVGMSGTVQYIPIGGGRESTFLPVVDVDGMPYAVVLDERGNERYVAIGGARIRDGRLVFYSPDGSTIDFVNGRVMVEGGEIVYTVPKTKDGSGGILTAGGVQYLVGIGDDGISLIPMSLDGKEKTRKIKADKYIVVDKDGQSVLIKAGKDYKGPGGYLIGDSIFVSKSGTYLVDKRDGMYVISKKLGTNETVTVPYVIPVPEKIKRASLAAYSEAEEYMMEMGDIFASYGGHGGGTNINMNPINVVLGDSIISSSGNRDSSQDREYDNIEKIAYSLANKLVNTEIMIERRRKELEALEKKHHKGEIGKDQYTELKDKYERVIKRLKESLENKLSYLGPSAEEVREMLDKMMEEYKGGMYEKVYGIGLDSNMEAYEHMVSTVAEGIKYSILVNQGMKEGYFIHNTQSATTG